MHLQYLPAYQHYQIQRCFTLGGVCVMREAARARRSNAYLIERRLSPTHVGGFGFRSWTTFSALWGFFLWPSPILVEGDSNIITHVCWTDLEESHACKMITSPGDFISKVSLHRDERRVFYRTKSACAVLMQQFVQEDASRPCRRRCRLQLT